jgi:hypothetical protein
MFHIDRRRVLRILNDDTDKKLDSISIFLTKEELMQLRSYLNQLSDDPDMDHVHLSSTDYQKEVTVCLYDTGKLDGLHPRSIKLIQKDE